MIPFALFLGLDAAIADEQYSAPYGWTGFYLGGHLGYAWGKSNWDASSGGSPTAAGSLNFSQDIDPFYETGSWLEGVQVGYNYALSNRIIAGVEADASFPPFPYPTNGLSIGGSASLQKGAETYSENVFASGTLRARIGYAPSNWLFYATGGLAWTDNKFALTQNPGGAEESSFQFRLGWTAGAGVEVPMAPNWTGRIEYLFKNYGTASVTFQSTGQHFHSDLDLQEFRVGVNYQFGEDAGSLKDAPKSGMLGDSAAFHAQATFVEQGYPAFRSPYQGPNSLPGGAEGRETTDITLFAGFRLWKGAELWIDPELDQGSGVGDTHGAAGYPSAEAYKEGSAYPYARVQRAFIRQSIELGGESEKVEADANVFAGTQSSNRIVVTIGRYYVTDLFDTNKYANNPKADFLNWSLVNAGTFDYAADVIGNTYGAAAEWYQDRFTLRGGIFDLSKTPTGGNSPLGVGLDPTFGQFQLVGEIEERHELWGQPGKLKLTGLVSRGRAGQYADAIALAEMTGQPADISAVRKYDSRPSVSLNLEQDIAPEIGVFARAGWADPNIEPWDFTDIDRTLQMGVSISGKLWGRADDRIGIAGVLNGISSIHEAFLNAGGLGILIGDGQLPHPGTEKILEAYYSYALTSSTKLSFDYQFLDNPGYNTDRGPVSLFAGRLHTQF
jgi:high affinity Mn2+ porin